MPAVLKLEYATGLIKVLSELELVKRSKRNDGNISKCELLVVELRWWGKQ